MIISITKGNPTRQMAICLSGTYDYTDAIIRVSYQGAVREFTGKKAGDALSFSFTGAETAVMALGTFPLQISVTLADGRTVSWTVQETKITVTDETIPGEILNINAQGALQGVAPLGETYTEDDMKKKLNEVIKRLGCIALCALSLGLFGSDAVTVTKQRKDTIQNTAQIVTDVTVDNNAIKAIVTNTVDKAFVESLGITGGGGSVDEEAVKQIVKDSLENPTENVIVTMDDEESARKIVFKCVDAPFLTIDGTRDDGSTVASGPLVIDANGQLVIEAGAVVYTEGERTLDEYGLSNAVATAIMPTDLKTTQALSYASGVYQYMHATTNAWFEGTNYNTNAEQAENKVKYSPEAWENVAFTPCSLQLYEIRDGERKCVWDQRDWTKYYTSAWIGSLSNYTANAITDVRTNYMRRGWAKYTAVNGLDNPSTDTLWIDTPKITMMAGMQWEKMVETGGTAYYTITGNGIELGPTDAQSTFLTIKDFEGNACLTFRKTSSYLVYCECGTDIVSNHMDDQGRVTFHFTTDVQPTAEFATVLDNASFVEQDADGCPASYEWTGSAGAWDCHFTASDPSARACFARFKVKKEGENIVEYSVPVRMNGGISFEQNGHTYKIKPSVSGNTVTWSVVQ